MRSTLILSDKKKPSMGWSGKKAHFVEEIAIAKALRQEQAQSIQGTKRRPAELGRCEHREHDFSRAQKAHRGLIMLDLGFYQ